MVEIKSLVKKTTAQTIEENLIVQQHRPYLGISQIGHHCERYLWYAFRWCFTESITPRLNRLFQRGHNEEPLIAETLSNIGIKIWGDQTEVVFAYGHGKGHNDGICSGVIEAPKTDHLLEDKTMNDKSFKDTCKQGVKASKPQYFTQCQLYMKFLKLTRTLFVAVNKNDDSMYIERIKYDKEFADKAEKKAEEIILSEEPPKKRFQPSWYQCKWCAANKICHGTNPVDENCRTCQNCDILPDGEWECNLHKIKLSTGQQRIGCNKYYVLNCLETLE